MAVRKKILFVCGSMNQTTTMHKISRYLADHDLWFTPCYTDGFLRVLERNRMIEWTVAGLGFQERAVEYCRKNELQVDVGGSLHDYDLVVTCSDLVVPKNIRYKRIVLVQEGMTDPENFAFYLVKYLGLPRYIASTSTFGMSDAYVRFCVASSGYRDVFVRKGARYDKMTVTGIPNFDNCKQFLDEPFEHDNYVLVATSDSRETFKIENRKKFIENALRIADGRKTIFKLHPNENIDRATKEIERWAPNALVYHSCDINRMIAHCDTLITRFSTVVYVGIALNKEVYSEFDIEMLRRCCPEQNGGRSAERIAEVCEEVLDRKNLVIPVSMSFPSRATSHKTVQA
ncbi:MAG: hypothetical protein SGJ05_09465 [bacterium]|nr:hypothetical protein [bacterium]